MTVDASGAPTNGRPSDTPDRSVAQAGCTELVNVRSELLRTARRRLRNPDWADDAVSETMVAALERQPEFSAPSQLKAWLFGVLRNKMVDQLRCHLGNHALAFVELSEASEDTDRTENGCGKGDPLQLAIGQQFAADLARQLSCLPELQSRAFVLRECWGQTTDEICAELGISANHLGVVLHRARIRLRQSLLDHRV